MTDFGQRNDTNLLTIKDVAPQLDDTDKLAVSTYGKGSAAGDTPVLVDSSGRPLVDLKLITGIAPQLDSTNKLAISNYGKNLAAGDTPILVDTIGRQTVAPHNTTLVAADGTSNNLKVLTGYGDEDLYNPSISYAFNESTWDRKRGNTNLTTLASAARTATTNSADQTNYNAKGLYVYFAITAVPGTDTVTLTIQAKGPVAGTYETLLTGAAEVGTATRCYLLYPGAGAAANGVDVVNAFPLPRTWRITITHSGSGSFTYSVGANLIL